jgi:predicted TIM-barrel fold metal-dependent hydrolase
MSGHRIISADDHVQEPKDTWERRVPAKLRDRAPKVVNVDGGDVWMLEGKVVMKMGMNAAAGKKFEEYKLEGETYQTIRPGAFDPYERIKDMDTDGVEGAVLFPNAFWAFMVEDFELQLACMRAYNDFLAEFCQTNPRRLIGIGLVPTDNVEEGVREAQRVPKWGCGVCWYRAFPRPDRSAAKSLTHCGPPLRTSACRCICTWQWAIRGGRFFTNSATCAASCPVRS